MFDWLVFLQKKRKTEIKTGLKLLINSDTLFNVLLVIYVDLF